MKDSTANRVSNCLALAGIVAIISVVVILLLSGCLLVQQDRLRNTVDGMRPLIFHTQGLD